MVAFFVAHNAPAGAKVSRFTQLSFKKWNKALTNFVFTFGMMCQVQLITNKMPLTLQNYLRSSKKSQFSF